jgi:hypothetical protein
MNSEGRGDAVLHPCDGKSRKDGAPGVKKRRNFFDKTNLQITPLFLGFYSGTIFANLRKQGIYLQNTGGG